MAYIGKKNFESANTESILEFIATAGQTTFTVGYSIGHCEVFLNGIKLAQGDFTANNGTSVVLTTGASLNDVVQIKSQSVKGLVDAYSTVQVDGLLANKASLAGATFTGPLKAPLGTSAGDVMTLGQDQSPFRNRIINGAMNVNQINGTTAVTPTSTSLTYISDQWGHVGAQASKLTYQQVIDAPTGFKYSTKITVASQYAPIATDAFFIEQPIEGQNITDFSFGTVDAKTIAVSLWVKGSVAGTYSISLRNATRAYIGTITITASWSKQTVVLVGDTSGAWTTDNTAAMYLAIDLGSGSNLNGTAGVWGAVTTRTSGSVTFVNQVAGSTLNITGVQLEKVPTGATQGTEYEWLSFDEEERRCARYLPVIKGVSNFIGSGQQLTSTTAYHFLNFLVPPRIAPSGITISSASHFIVINSNAGASFAISSLAFGGASNNMAQISSIFASNSGIAGQVCALLCANANAKILFTGAQL